MSMFRIFVVAGLLILCIGQYPTFKTGSREMMFDFASMINNIAGDRRSQR